MIYHDLVKELDETSLNEDIKNGLTRLDIHNSIISTFSNYFDNKENLERYSNDFLVHDWINYKKIYYTNIDKDIKEVMDIFKKSKSTDFNKTMQGFSEFQNITTEMGNKHWSMLILQRDLAKLDDFEYVAESFNIIDNITEVLVKNFLFIVIYCYRIEKGKHTLFEEIMKLKFGNIMNELIQANLFSSLLNVDSNGISVSQWRNIACHKTYEFKEGKIVCTYGTNLDNTVILHSKEELFEITKKINRISQIVNFASKFFCYDNIQDISTTYSSSNNKPNARGETWHLIFVTELYTAGFKVIDIEDTSSNIKVTLQDITAQDKGKRAIQSSIAIYKAWALTSKENIEIIYLDIEGLPMLSSSATSDICERISTGEKDIHYLGEKATFIKLNDY